MSFCTIAQKNRNQFSLISARVDTTCAALAIKKKIKDWRAYSRYFLYKSKR